MWTVPSTGRAPLSTPISPAPTTCWKPPAHTGPARADPGLFAFTHISTDEVYGSLPADPEVRFTEDTAYDPRSPYSASKAVSDHLVRAWHETYGLPVVLTNCSNNYGPYHFPEKLIPVINPQCAGRQADLPIYGDGSAISATGCMSRITQTRCCLVVERGVLGRSYNIGGENERTNLELVQTLCGILDTLRPRSKTANPMPEQIRICHRPPRP